LFWLLQGRRDAPSDQFERLALGLGRNGDKVKRGLVTVRDDLHPGEGGQVPEKARKIVCGLTGVGFPGGCFLPGVPGSFCGCDRVHRFRPVFVGVGQRRHAGLRCQNCRYALWKNPKNLTEKQQTKPAWIVQTDPQLARAYYLKEGLRVIVKLPLDETIKALDKWVGWARRCRIPSFVKLQKSIVKHRTAILASIEHGLSNGRVESMNTKIRLMTRIAFGFKSPEALIALAMLSLGGHKPVLPGRI
jgi:hypothetical protein